MRNLSKNFISFFLPILLSSLVFLGFFVPLETKAGFLSSIFGDQASASTNASNVDNNSNSQNMSLLQANVSSASADDPSILSNNALLPATGPLGVADATNSADSSADQVSIYVVRKGDSITQIAQMFGVSINTILSANDMKRGDKLVEGSTLFILPISGIEHTITKGQTIKSIAKLYSVDVNDITSYNGIAPDTKLVAGEKIMIPGADNMADEGGDKPAANLGSALARDAKYYANHLFLQDLINYFIDPLPTGRKTQGLHGPGHRGIDIGAPKGAPILASASGTVSFTHSGWSGGYGKVVIIDHPNGAKTLYAHMSEIATSAGDQVAQGEIIGYVGSTGHSTGPHLHFEVFNARNPGANWAWKN